MADPGSSNLAPLEVPHDPDTPSWVIEAIKRLNMLTGATVAPRDPKGGYGSGLFSFGAQNAVALVPFSNVSAQIPLTKLTAGGSAGSITIVNGIVTAFQTPS